VFKKWGLLLIVLLSLTVTFASVSINVENTTVQVGESIKIEVTTDQATLTHLYVDVNNGGFDDPMILFDGFNIKGTAEIIFLAPLIPGESKISFYDENNTIKKDLTLNIVEKKVEIPDTKLMIVEKKGNVLYKNSDSEVWDTINKDNFIQENSELLTLEQGYIKLKEPNLDIEINVSSETQLFIKKLRAAENGDIDIEYELKKGATVNKINEVLAPGSRYIVSSGSVVAGVRGTEFGFEKIGGKTKVRTFKGTVYTMVNNQLFPVTANNMLTFDNNAPKLDNLDKNLGDYEKDITPKTEENVTPDTTTKPNTETTPAQPKANIGDISFGKQQKGKDNYLVYSFAPEFDFGAFGFGIGFNAYQNDIDSPLYYGIPTESASPSENIMSAISINYLKLDFPSFYIRYGISPSYTKGLGLFINNYYIPYSRVFDAELRLNSLRIGGHIPYELNSFVPFTYSQSSNIYFGYLDANLGLLNTEITGIINLNDEKTANEFSQAYLATIYKDILFFRLGVEGDVVFTNDGSMLYGALAGPTINFPPYFQFMFGVNYLSNGFNMEYLNPYYEYNSANGIYMDLNTESSFGLMGKSTFSLDPYLNLLINYNKLFSENRDSLLKGELSVNIPSLGKFPQLTAGFSYMQYKFLEDDTVDNVFLNDNTNLKGYIYYPVLESSGVIYSVKYNMRDKKFEYSLSFETKEF